MNTDPVVVERTYNALVADVWRAITDKDQMRQWFFKTMTDFVPELGFEVLFNVHCEGRDYPHQWKVTEVVPEKRIAYGWRYAGYPGNSTVAWELSETPGGTRLKVIHDGIQTFPRDNPVFSRESTQTGWSYLLHESLKAFLDQQVRKDAP